MPPTIEASQCTLHQQLHRLCQQSASLPGFSVFGLTLTSFLNGGVGCIKIVYLYLVPLGVLYAHFNSEG
jgi:hypothetical protein